MLPLDLHSAHPPSQKGKGAPRASVLLSSESTGQSPEEGGWSPCSQHLVL